MRSATGALTAFLSFCLPDQPRSSRWRPRSQACSLPTGLSARVPAVWPPPCPRKNDGGVFVTSFPKDRSEIGAPPRPSCRTQNTHAHALCRSTEVSPSLPLEKAASTAGTDPSTVSWSPTRSYSGHHSTPPTSVLDHGRRSRI